MEKLNNQSLVLTDSALSRIKTIMNSNQELSSKFRVYVTGGGCSGFQYGFKFDSEIAFDDDIIEFENFSVLLDSMSYPYLYGSTLDFVEDLSGAKFVVKNPNAKQLAVVENLLLFKFNHVAKKAFRIFFAFSLY